MLLFCSLFLFYRKILPHILASQLNILFYWSRLLPSNWFLYLLFTFQVGSLLVIYLLSSYVICMCAGVRVCMCVIFSSSPMFCPWSIQSNPLTNTNPLCYSKMLPYMFLGQLNILFCWSLLPARFSTCYLSSFNLWNVCVCQIPQNTYVICPCAILSLHNHLLALRVYHKAWTIRKVQTVRAIKKVKNEPSFFGPPAPLHTY